MPPLRSVAVPVMSILLLIATAALAPGLAQQGDLEQRVAGLEGRVTVLEQELAALRTGDIASPASDEAYTIAGTLRLRQDRDESVIFIESAGICSGTRGFDDIRTGTNVVILDGSGNTLATAQLVLREGFSATGSSSNICEFSFSVTVPETSFYTAQIGRRGAPTYSFEDMERNGWKMELSIGS